MATCMTARWHERNVSTAAFRSDEADIGLRFLPRVRPSSNLTLMSRSARGRELGMHSHGSMHGGGTLSDGAMTVNLNFGYT